MHIETLQERITNAQNKIGKKQRTILKKQELIVKKQHLLDTKYPNSRDIPEARTLQWDIEHYTDDISRLEREIEQTSINLEGYQKQLDGLMERISVLINDLPEVLKDLQDELVERWDRWDKERRDKIRADYLSMDWKEFSRHYTHADVELKGKSDEGIHENNLQAADNLIIDLIYRVRKITGEITDWSNIRATAGTGGFTVLNGLVIGKEGRASIESITAGGYNIQRLHIRVLVHSV